MIIERRPLWIVVADTAEARIYSCLGAARPVLVEVLSHPAAHGHDRELKSDRAGRGQRDVGGSFSFAPAMSALDTERDRFARAIAAAIDRGLAVHRFVELALVMPPKLLGLVRAHLGPAAHDAIVASLDRRLNGMPVDEIALRVADARVEAQP